MEIFNYLQENTRDKLSVNKINWFGRILHKLNVPKKPVSEVLYTTWSSWNNLFSRNEYEVNALILIYVTIINSTLIISELYH